MKFLSVFCVVLCIRSGAFLHIQNNVPDIRYQNQEATQLSAHRNTEIPLNNPYDDEFRRNQPIGRYSEQLNPKQNVRFESQRISPEYINSQQIKNTNEKLLNEEHRNGKQDHYFQDQAYPKYINPPVRRLIEAQSNPKEDDSKTTVKENIRLESQRISPKYLNWQQIKNTNEQLINQEDSINQRGQYIRHQTHPEHILPEAKRFNKAQHTPEENISGSKLQFSNIHETVRHNILPLKHVDIESVLTDSKNINMQPIKRLNEAKLMPVEDTKLELQAVSPEYIKSLINEDKPGLEAKLSLISPYEKVNSAKVVKHLDNKQFHSKNHFEQDEAIYENPSAEVLYSTKRALPYKIEGQQLPNISQGSINFFNNANSPKRIQDIQKLMQPSKRYMIIHPDGRVEHIDEIEKITKMHPNYVMIKSQDFLKRMEGKSGISGLQISQLFANNLHDAIVNQKHNQAPDHHLTDMPSGHKSPPQVVKNPLHSKDTDSLGKLIVSNEPNIHPTQIKTVKVYSQISPENNNQHDENQLLNKENMHRSSSLVPEIEKHEKNNYIKNGQTITQFTPIVKENEFKNIELTSVSPSDIQQIQTKNEQQISAYDSSLLASSTIATITEKNNDNFNKTVIIKVNKTENTTSPFVNLTLKDNLPTLPHERQIMLNDESEQYNLNTLLVPKTSMSTPAIITENSIKNMNQIVPYQNSTEPLQNSTVTMLNTTVPTNTTQVFYTNHETIKNTNHELSDTLSSSTSPEIGAISNTSATFVSIPIKTSVSSNDQEESTNKNVTTNIMQTCQNVTSSPTPLSNTENTTNNTGFWFQADEQFWHNIMSNNNTHNLFYFFFVPPKPNIMQKETKTTLYPNGTTVEEVIETIDEDGVPRVKRTTKVFLNNTTPDA